MQGRMCCYHDFVHNVKYLLQFCAAVFWNQLMLTVCIPLRVFNKSLHLVKLVKPVSRAEICIKSLLADLPEAIVLILIIEYINSHGSSRLCYYVASLGGFLVIVLWRAEVLNTISQSAIRTRATRLDPTYRIPSLWSLMYSCNTSWWTLVKHFM